MPSLSRESAEHFNNLWGIIQFIVKLVVLVAFVDLGIMDRVVKVEC